MIREDSDTYFIYKAAEKYHKLPSEIAQSMTPWDILMMDEFDRYQNELEQEAMKKFEAKQKGVIKRGR